MRNPWVSFVVLGLLMASSAEARRSRSLLEVEPVVGYERTYKTVPTPRTTERLVYGVRVIFGGMLLSTEAEYLRAQDSESIGGITYKDTDDMARLGLRSQVGVGKLRFIARAGAQAKRNIHEETIGVVTTRTENPISYKPYAGAGLRWRFGKRSRFWLNAEVVAVFRDFPDNLDQTDYQGLLTLTLSL